MLICGDVEVRYIRDALVVVNMKRVATQISAEGK